MSSSWDSGGDLVGQVGAGRSAAAAGVGTAAASGLEERGAVLPAPSGSPARAPGSRWATATGAAVLLSAAQQSRGSEGEGPGGGLLQGRRGTRQQQRQQPRQLQRRLPVAEVAVCGEIVGATGFGARTLSCGWQLVLGPHWQLLRGEGQGRTHVSGPASWDGTETVWEHPISFVVGAHSRQRWPSIVFKVYHRAVFHERDAFVGYGLLRLPIAAGLHAICSCPVWRPVQARRSHVHLLRGWFGGVAPQLVDEEFLTDLDKRFQLGQGLHTEGVAAGRVTVRLHVLARNLDALPSVVPAPTVMLPGAKQSSPEPPRRRTTVEWAPVQGAASGGGPGGGRRQQQEQQQQPAEGWQQQQQQQQRAAVATTAWASEEGEEQQSPGLRFVRAGRAARFARALAGAPGLTGASQGPQPPAAAGAGGHAVNKDDGAR